MTQTPDSEGIVPSASHPTPTDGRHAGDRTDLGTGERASESWSAPSAYPGSYPSATAYPGGTAYPGQSYQGQGPEGQSYQGATGYPTGAGYTDQWMFSSNEQTAQFGAVPPADDQAWPSTKGPRAKGRRGLVALVAGACLTAGAVGGIVGVGLADEDSPSAAAPADGGSISAVSVSTADGTVAGAAAKIIPSTVVIEVTGGGRSGGQVGGSGSGVVLDTDGNILTNAHVVTAGGALTNPRIEVNFSDGTTAAAEIVGIDESSDLAVLNVSGVDGLTPANFADSDDLVIGQAVVAVGAPLGLSGTVTEGIVSSVDRPVRTGDSQDASTVLDAVQTDAAINPGNSGGPLVDLAGSVVGINSAIASVSAAAGEAGNIGVGFAIPANDAVDVANQLVANGRAVHASLGVSASETETGTGAQIRSVEQGSAAAEAGIEEGDIVTAVGDRPVHDLDGLLAAIRDYQPGDQVSVTVDRHGSDQEITVTLGSREG